MEHFAQQNQTACPSPEISAYLDGELSERDELRLEIHIGQCELCREDLNLQKSFLNALDLSIEDEKSIELPSDFTKTVVVNAESRVSGLRRPHERRNAAFICAGLLIFSFVALGGNTDGAFAAAAAMADKFAAVAAAAVHFVYDIALGTAIVFRSLASNFVFGSTATAGLFLVVFLLSLYSFSRLLGRFRRT
ncbi:MAG TPA: zf-HC2 domain-containing protein [Pyrinomonadaceae bacterium]